MPEVRRVTRTSYTAGRDRERERERDDQSSDDERSNYAPPRRTVQRYRVVPRETRGEEGFDDSRSVRTTRGDDTRKAGSERLDVERSFERERFVEPTRDRVEVERRVDRERIVEREPERERVEVERQVDRERIVEREREPERERIESERIIEHIVSPDRERHSMERTVEVDRVVERERSFEPRDKGEGGRRIETVERYLDVDRDDIPRSAVGHGSRSAIVEREQVYEREPAREPERERTRTIVYERERPREREVARPWERSRHDRPWEIDPRESREADMQIEKRVERADRRYHDEGYELERYSRETEYYERPERPEPVAGPIIIRQRIPEPQQIIVQEAPPPSPVIIRDVVAAETTVSRREEFEPERARDQIYYRRDVREIGGQREKQSRRSRHRHDSQDEDSDDGYYVEKRVVKEKERGSSPNHKRHLAEGALAGAGVSALLLNHREKRGDGTEHRGRQVAGGAALGAIGAEVLTRARSRYRDVQERKENRSRSRSKSRSKSKEDPHRRLKTAIGLGALALAGAAALKYTQTRVARQEELARGRSRTRERSRRRGGSSRGAYSDSDSYDPDDDGGRSQSRHTDPAHRKAQIAKAGVATAAVAGIVEHFRNKSRQREGGRSKSRIRTGAEIAGAGLAGAAVAGIYENRKAKEEHDVAEREDTRDDRRRAGSRSRSRSRSRSVSRSRERTRERSRARSTTVYSDPGVDPELGMVQYGTEPVYTHHTTTTYEQYEHPVEPVGQPRSRRRSRRAQSEDEAAAGRPRSRSRGRDLAGAALATGAAAIGVHEYKKRSSRKDIERERERRQAEEDLDAPENYYRDDDAYSPSPPLASDMGYYPESPAPSGITQHYNRSAPDLGPPIPRSPADYADERHEYFAPPPRGVPGVDHTRDRDGAFDSDSPAIHTPGSESSFENSNTNTSQAAKSVNFAPLSPISSRRLDRTLRERHEKVIESDSGLSDSSHGDNKDEDEFYRRQRRRRKDAEERAGDGEVEVLPDRFDGNGRQIDGGGVGGHGEEMVERVIESFGAVAEGRMGWGELLREIVGGGGGGGSGSERGVEDRPGNRERRSSRRRRRDQAGDDY